MGIVEVPLDDDPPAAVAPPRRRHRRWWIVAAVATGAAAATIAGVWSRPHPEDRSVPRLPTEAELQWTTELAVNQVDGVAGDGDTLVAQVDWDSELVAIDASTGEVRWTIDAPATQFGELTIVEEVVVGVHGAISDMTAFDVGTGEFVWSRPIDDAVIDPNRILALDWDAGSGLLRRVERVDPRTGQTSGVIEADEIVVGSQTITARRGDRLTVFDANAVDRLGEIDVADFDDTILSAAPTTDGFVLATASQVGVADRAGAMLSVTDLAGEAEQFPDVTLLPVGDQDLFAAVRSGSVSMLAVAGHDVEVLWHRPGQFAGATDEGEGLVAVLASVDRASVRVSRSSGLPLDPRSATPSEVVDARTGTTMWQIDQLEPWLDPIVSTGEHPPLTSTGLLTLAHPSSDDVRPPGTLRGLDLGGVPMWELELPLLVELRLEHDALVTFELDTAAARVRVSRWG